MLTNNREASIIATSANRSIMEIAMTTNLNDPDPWDQIQPRDLERMGEIVADRKEQERWSRAVMLAGALPYM
jgi:hypothetical protein